MSNVEIVIDSDPIEDESCIYACDDCFKLVIDNEGIDYTLGEMETYHAKGHPPTGTSLSNALAYLGGAK